VRTTHGIELATHSLTRTRTRTHTRITAHASPHTHEVQVPPGGEVAGQASGRGGLRPLGGGDDRVRDVRPHHPQPAQQRHLQNGYEPWPFFCSVGQFSACAHVCGGACACAVALTIVLQKAEWRPTKRRRLWSCCASSWRT
jgi:hypothetical protein